MNHTATGKKNIFGEKGKRTSIFYYSFEAQKVEEFKKQLKKDREEIRQATREAKKFLS